MMLGCRSCDMARKSFCSLSIRSFLSCRDAISASCPPVCLRAINAPCHIAIVLLVPRALDLLMGCSGRHRISLLGIHGSRSSVCPSGAKIVSCSKRIERPAHDNIVIKANSHKYCQEYSQKFSHTDTEHAHDQKSTFPLFRLFSCKEPPPSCDKQEQSLMSRTAQGNFLYCPVM
eukprot:scpid86130/ scgid10651/ 